MTADPQILILDGYTKSSRDGLAAGGASVAGDLYAAMLKRIVPDAQCHIIFPSDADAALPSGTGLADYDAIAWTGCSLTVFDDTREVRTQLDFARAAFEAKIPSFGSCWGAQIAVVAAGGIVQANPRGREMGIARKIELTPEGRAHPMFEGKASVFDAFISHVDEITHLPPGAVSLARNAFTLVQAVSVVHKGGTFWSPQYHPEYTLHEIARLTHCRADILIDLGFFADAEAVASYVDLMEVLYQHPGRRDIAWLLGIDEDVMNEDVRCQEVRNWITHQVLPGMGR